jgi:hypothetical protein
VAGLQLLVLLLLLLLLAGLWLRMLLLHLLHGRSSTAAEEQQKKWGLGVSDSCLAPLSSQHGPDRIHSAWKDALCLADCS